MPKFYFLCFILGVYKLKVGIGNCPIILDNLRIRLCKFKKNPLSMVVILFKSDVKQTSLSAETARQDLKFSNHYTQ